MDFTSVLLGLMETMCNNEGYFRVVHILRVQGDIYSMRRIDDQ